MQRYVFDFVSVSSKYVVMMQSKGYYNICTSRNSESPCVHTRIQVSQ